jgi:hypothetical protein
LNVNRIEAPVIINLGALECASSCIMTALAAFELNPQHLLLSYWDINYAEGNLLSSRIPWYIDLLTIYGMQMSFYEHERLDPILASISAGHIIMYQSKASALSFFPKELLVHEAGGFDHYCLLVDYDHFTHSFTVVDPIASYIGGITKDELAVASMNAGKFCYYELDRPPANFSSPRPAKLLEIGAAFNYNTMCHNPNGGLKAFDQLADELDASLQWDSARREAWLHSNTITISSTIRIRRLIWESYAGLSVLNEQQFKAFESLAKVIVTHWTRLNLSLIKYKQRGNPEMVATCRQLLTKLQEAEKQFILEMHELGRQMADYAGKGETG